MLVEAQDVGSPLDTKECQNAPGGGLEIADKILVANLDAFVLQTGASDRQNPMTETNWCHSAFESQIG